MARQYTDSEMFARQQALAKVQNYDTMIDLFVSEGIAEAIEIAQRRTRMHEAPETERETPQVLTPNGIDKWLASQPAYAPRNYARPQPGGKQMQAKFNGKCVDCQGPISIGDDIRYDGKTHHAGQNTCDYWREQLAKQASEPDADFSDVPVETTPRETTPVRNGEHAEAPSEVSDGRYTIVREDGTHLTIRIATPTKESKFFGERIISYLYGADNDNDYTGFAFLKPGNRIVVWKRYADNQELRNAAQFLMDPANAADAGFAYALASSRCWRCGHTLTVPASIHRGLGPDCATKVAFS